MLHLTIAHFVSAVGLTFDLLGVVVLGFDLIRLQRDMRREARLRADEVSNLYDGFIPPDQWADEIRASTRWVGEHEYSEHHAEHEVSYNARRFGDALKDVAGTFDFIAVRLVTLATMAKNRDARDAQGAAKSLWLSITGMVLILIGFFLQLAGTFLS